MIAKKITKWIIVIIGLAISIGLSIFYPDVILSIKNYLREQYSSDGVLNPKTILKVEKFIVFIILLLLSLTIIYALNLKSKITFFLNKYININKVRLFFTTDDICNKKWFPGYTFVIVTIVSFGMHLHLLILGFPRIEGPIEGLSTILFFVSAIVLLISSTRIGKIITQPRIRNRVVFSLVFISIGLLYIFGEEISWGQQIFGWDSYGVFKEHNFQEETNTHNFFNPVFDFAYPFVGTGSFILLFFMWFFPKEKRTYLFDLFFPHQSFFFLFFVMACSSFFGESEIYEFLLSVFFIFYSFRIYFSLKDNTNMGGVKMNQ